MKNNSYHIAIKKNCQQKVYFFMEINFDRMGYGGTGQGREAAAAWNEPGLGWDFLLELPIRFH